MCRNIKQLYNFEPHATSDEVHAAAVQFVRKVSGMNKPSTANEAVFNHAIKEIEHACYHLLEGLETNAPLKDREVEAAKAKARAIKRFGT